MIDNKLWRDSAVMMFNEDYAARFQAEYIQTKYRYDRLYQMIAKYDDGTLDFKPTCDIELLKEQARAMGNYLYCLEVRAQEEGIYLC